ncbi:DUF4493 domain-containing protein [Maribacter arenosus]|uniref:DUF4493 domain-containing protein n=1 Tax=Maribacter arenosus TaxID=1854708 RepID=A0ABR7V7L8_9FLAO|nr:DUF4493 domain-containing protein [Maribacter arenosus]MBD0849669.1 DUF4493 domain-containing protein [Maribacter arenosus]
MKTKLKNAVSLLALSLFILACSKGNEDLSHLYEDEAEVPIEVALELGSISLKPVIKDVIIVNTGKAPTLDEVLDYMAVLIQDTEGNQVLSSNYRDLPEFIELAPGDYRFFMSNWVSTSARFDNPIHGTNSLGFTVTSGENTVLAFSLKLFDVATTINLSDAVKTSYPDISVNAGVFNYYNGISNNLTWNIIDDGRIGYFDLVERDNLFLGSFSTTIGDMTIDITATSAAGAPINVTSTYTGVSANEHYVISIEQSSATTLSLSITLNDEIVINETITFPN